MCDYKCVCEELSKLDPQNPLGAGRRITISDKQIEVVKELNKRGGLSAAGIGRQVKLPPVIVKRIIRRDLEQMHQFIALMISWNKKIEALLEMAMPRCCLVH